MKDVALYLDGSSADEPRIEHAAAICRRFEAHLTGLYLNAVPSLVIAGDGGPTAAALAWDTRSDAVDAGNATERRLVERLAVAAPLSELRRHDLYVGQFAEAVAGQGRISDLTVVTRPYGEGAADIDPDVAEAALFGSGRGALVVPPTGTVPDRYQTILLGWRHSREAARAVMEAMPFLRAAEQVSVVMIDEGGAPAEQGEEPAADIARHLDRHGVPVEVRHLSRWDRPAEGLINEAKLIGADLIVAGAYGHSRLREWVMGGTTRDLLKNSPLPLLMAH